MRTFIPPALLCWLAMLAAYPLAPVAVAFATSDGALPRWAWWLETHDNPGWQGPLSEGYPATRWGLVRWLWRNKAYALRDRYRASIVWTHKTMFTQQRGSIVPAEIGPSWWLGRIGRYWELELSLGLYAFRIYLRAGWKLKPYFLGHRPTGPTATGMLIPISIRTDDFSE